MNKLSLKSKKIIVILSYVAGGKKVPINNSTASSLKLLENKGYIKKSVIMDKSGYKKEQYIPTRKSAMFFSKLKNMRR